MCQTLKTYDSLHGCYRFTVQQLLFGSFVDKCLKETDSKDRGHIYCYLLLAVRSAALNRTFVTLDICGRSVTQLYLHSCILCYILLSGGSSRIFLITLCVPNPKPFCEQKKTQNTTDDSGSRVKDVTASVWKKKSSSADATTLNISLRFSGALSTDPDWKLRTQEMLTVTPNVSQCGGHFIKFILTTSCSWCLQAADHSVWWYLL